MLRFLSTIAMISMLLACAPHQSPKATLDAIIDANAREHGIPAQSVAITHNGQPYYQRQTGTLHSGDDTPVDEQTVFPVFSVSKVLATVLLFQQVEAGRIDLDMPANHYLPELPAPWSAITVRQFLDHVSGVGEYFDQGNLYGQLPPTLDAALANAGALPLIDVPNTKSRYTQTNFLVIAALIEAVSGKPYRELLQAQILDPLGRDDIWLGSAAVPAHRLVSDYRSNDGTLAMEQPIAWPDYAAAHTGIHATASGMAALLDAIAAGQFASAQALEQLWRPHVLANGDYGFFASGWDYGESGDWREVGHDGGAKLRVRILFKRDPSQERYVIVYLANGSADNVWSRTLVDSIQSPLLAGITR